MGEHTFLLELVSLSDCIYALWFFKKGDCSWLIGKM